MTQSITIKAGATFSVPFLALLPAGTWACDSDVRTSADGLAQALATTLTAPIRTRCKPQPIATSA